MTHRDKDRPGRDNDDVWRALEAYAEAHTLVIHTLENADPEVWHEDSSRAIHAQLHGHLAMFIGYYLSLRQTDIRDRVTDEEARRQMRQFAFELPDIFRRWLDGQAQGN
jgi:hypothetical protein